MTDTPEEISANPEAAWYYRAAGVSQGPVTLAMLQDLFTQGVLTAESKVSGPEVFGWQPLAAAAPSLSGLPEPTAPVDAASLRGRWTETKPHPWRRYFARMIDTALFGGIGSFSLFFVLAAASLIDPDRVEKLQSGLNPFVWNWIWAIAVFPLAIPLQAITIGLTGLTPGKWLFGVRIRSALGKNIGVSRALLRELRVWVFGLGLGLPLVSLFCGLHQSTQLNETGATPWDKKAKLIVAQRRSGLWQLLLFWVGVGIWLVLSLWGVAERIISGMR